MDRRNDRVRLVVRKANRSLVVSPSLTLLTDVQGGPYEGLGFDIVLLQIGFDGRVSSATLWNTARRMASSVIRPKNRSTRLIQEAEVGVK